MDAYFQFLDGLPESSLLYEGSYDSVLVALSVLVAMFAAFGALDVAGRLGEARNAGMKLVWLATGSLTLGIGIWAMHFLGMLAFSLPCQVHYDPLITLTSMVPGILVSSVTLYIISLRVATFPHLLIGGVILGSGIGAMHYSGMAAMRMDALLRYDRDLFLLSIGIAVALSILALWIKFAAQNRLAKFGRWVAPTASAIVMGGAVSGMHYTAMGAAYFVRFDDPNTDIAASDPTFLAVSVTVTTGLLTALGLAATVAHRYFSVAARLREEIAGRRKVEAEKETLAADHEIVAAILSASLAPTPLKEFLQEALDIVLTRQHFELLGMGSISLMEGDPPRLKMVAQKDLAPKLLTLCNEIEVGHCLCGRAAETGRAVVKTCLDHHHETTFEGIKDHGHMCLPIKHESEVLGVLNLYIPHAHDPTMHERRFAETVAGTLAGVIWRNKGEADVRRAKEKAEIASRTKSEFLANMSHELRTPLNAIIGFSEGMRNSLFGPLGNAKYEEYTEHIHASGTHLLEVINDILDVSAVEAGKLELHETEVNLIDTCEAAIRILLPKAQEGCVSLSGITDPALPLLKADSRRLKQILLNLLSNAVKFTPENGSVSCDAYLESGGTMLITVTDTGIGMDGKAITKAMSTFGQVDGSLSRAHEGTGLGLPLTKGLIEVHGGTMDLTSTPGAGTKVTITLPADRVVREPG